LKITNKISKKNKLKITPKKSLPKKNNKIIQSKVDVIYSIDSKSKHLVKFFDGGVRAGFPSPAEDYFEESIDLNQYLIKHPSATFMVKVVGDSMIDAGIFANDILIVDRSLEAKNNSIVIASINSELTVKRLIKKNSEVFLKPENKKYQPIKILDYNDNLIWGVVTSVIHKF
jgi:DNA polymerase V